MQTQTRRLQKIALLATRQEAEFVSGVLEAADVPHAVVEVDAGLELRVDPDDAPKVRELIDRLDVKREVGESTRQRQGEAAGRRLVVVLLLALTVAAAAWWLLGLLPLPALVTGLLRTAALVVLVTLAVLAVIRRKPAR